KGKGKNEKNDKPSSPKDASEKENAKIQNPNATQNAANASPKKGSGKDPSPPPPPKTDIDKQGPADAGNESGKEEKKESEDEMTSEEEKPKGKGRKHDKLTHVNPNADPTAIRGDNSPVSKNTRAKSKEPKEPKETHDNSLPSSKGKAIGGKPPKPKETEPENIGSKSSPKLPVSSPKKKEEAEDNEGDVQMKEVDAGSKKVARSGGIAVKKRTKAQSAETDDGSPENPLILSGSSAASDLNPILAPPPSKKQKTNAKKKPKPPPPPPRPHGAAKKQKPPTNVSKSKKEKKKKKVPKAVPKAKQKHQQTGRWQDLTASEPIHHTDTGLALSIGFDHPTVRQGFKAFSNLVQGKPIVTKKKKTVLLFGGVPLSAYPGTPDSSESEMSEPTPGAN
ncbi:MAG: hypothetical protein GY940_20410, partial [bacterium]|nr:hypothetical protein [bacterium]